MIILNILKLLTKREKLICVFLILMAIVMAFLDMIGIASIMPFVYVLADPSKIEDNLFLKYFYKAGQFNNPDQYLLFLGIIFFIFIVLSLLFKAITNFFQYKFILTREYTIGKRLFSNYLNQSYSVFLNKNTSDYANNILSEVNQVIVQAFIPLMNLVGNICVSFAIFCLLILVDLKLSLLILIGLGSSYFLIYYFVSRYLEVIGRQKLSANEKRFRIINESFGGIKEIKLNNLESYFLSKFSKQAKIFATNQSISTIISLMPRYILEVLTFGGMLSIILYLFSKNSDINQSLPIIALFALAGYKLIPSLQQIYASLSSLKFAKGSINNLSKELRINNQGIVLNDQINSLNFNKFISLTNINFQYPESKTKAITNINLKIEANTTTAFVGTTGGGKSTLVDILVGLLLPDSGHLAVDGLKIDNANVLSWQKIIGYVPQSIFLADTTIAKNIAFGQSDYDLERVKKVAKVALIDDFVENNLPEQYETNIGENGVKLSGGQKQRIGIARALYKSPKVLILDEATSALDNITEKKVMQSIFEISSHITIILIAHRLSSIVNCSKIYLVNEGSIIEGGTFEELQKNNIFRDMSQNF